MKPDRGLRRNSLSCVFSDVSMMRSPIGSTPDSSPSSRKNIPFSGLVFGTVALSNTVIQGVAGMAVKYCAATLISSSVIIWAKRVIRPVLAFLGSDVFLAPLRKSIICWMKYSYVRPVMLAFSGRPLPLG
jgi:hypothetical protein